MNESNNRTPESRSKVYIYVILGLLVFAVGVTAIATLLNRDGNDPIAEGSELMESIESFLEDSVFENSMFEESMAEDSRFEDSRIENSMLEDSQQEDSGWENSIPGNEDESKTPVNQGDVEANSGIEQDQPVTGVTQWEAFDPASMELIWPVSGVVVKNYSVNSLIYDETLDIYSVNDSISISAEEAEAVMAAADGVVTEIGRSDRLGNYVVLNNGNGYETTYGQMDENLEVAVGDVVHAGDVLGRISSPSWYSVALGTHLTFQVTLQDTAVNPLDYLENELED